MERKYDGKVIGDIDASIVTDHMMLCAASLGLDTLWICMFKPEAVRAEFNLPEHVEPGDYDGGDDTGGDETGGSDTCGDETGGDDGFSDDSAADSGASSEEQ